MSPEQAYEFYLTKHTVPALHILCGLVNDAIPSEHVATLSVEPDDFCWFDSAWAIDGMDPLEWVEAMTME